MFDPVSVIVLDSEDHGLYDFDEVMDIDMSTDYSAIAKNKRANKSKILFTAFQDLKDIGEIDDETKFSDWKCDNSFDEYRESLIK